MREVTILLQQHVPLSVYMTEDEFAETVPVLDSLLKREIEIGVVRTSMSQISLRSDLFSAYSVKNFDADSVRAVIALQSELKRIEKEIGETVEAATSKGVGFSRG